jgi:HSP20 family molecular chaperone IbpA
MYLNVYRPSVVQRVNGRAFGGLVDSVLNEVLAAQSEDSVTVHARFDVVEKGDAYEAFIEIPGVAKEDIASMAPK